MKSLRLTLPICALSLLVLASSAVAQDADKAKLIEIEKAFAASANPGPESAAVAKQYLYDGPLNQLTPMGRVGMLPKARVMEFFTAPDPTDPNVKTSVTLADFHVDLYGTTALVTYKQSNTDTGHKDPALNVTEHFGCLDTFVKRNAAWTIIGTACSPDQPIPQAVWDAVKKAMSQQPKDIQQAYH
jgi:hypothetical protein